MIYDYLIGVGGVAILMVLWVGSQELLKRSNSRQGSGLKSGQGSGQDYGQGDQSAGCTYAGPACGHCSYAKNTGDDSCDGEIDGEESLVYSGDSQQGEDLKTKL